MSEQIHLISRWIVKNGFQDKAETCLQKFEQMALEEEGTLLYLIHRPMWDIDLISRPEPRQLEVLFVEIYRDKDAFNTHVKNQMKYLKESGSFEYFQTPLGKPEQAAEMVEFLQFERGVIKPDLNRDP